MSSPLFQLLWKLYRKPSTPWIARMHCLETMRCFFSMALGSVHAVSASKTDSGCRSGSGDFLGDRAARGSWEGESEAVASRVISHVERSGLAGLLCRYVRKVDSSSCSELHWNRDRWAPGSLGARPRGRGRLRGVDAASPQRHQGRGSDCAASGGSEAVIALGASGAFFDFGGWAPFMAFCPSALRVVNRAGCRTRRLSGQLKGGKSWEIRGPRWGGGATMERDQDGSTERWVPNGLRAGQQWSRQGRTAMPQGGEEI